MGAAGKQLRAGQSNNNRARGTIRGTDRDVKYKYEIGPVKVQNALFSRRLGTSSGVKATVDRDAIFWIFAKIQNIGGAQSKTEAKQPSKLADEVAVSAFAGIGDRRAQQDTAVR